MDKPLNGCNYFGMFWIALAAAASMPAMDNGGLWTIFKADDTPVQLIPQGEGRRVGVRLTVDPAGNTKDCQAESSSGDPNVDAYTCEIILRRARFHPAIGSDGLPAFGVLRTRVTWVIDATPLPPPADVELRVSTLPKGFKDPIYVDLMLDVDEVGHPLSCVAENPSPPDPKPTAELLQVACDQLLKTYVAIPAKDATGKPVRSIQDATVSISTKRRR